jgi:MFS family permease
MILDMGFMLGPILSTQILENFNFQFVFLASLIIDTIVILIAAKSIGHVNHTFHGVLTVKGILGKLLHRPNIMRIYYISFVLEFFYAIMIIYMPIYLRDIGISWTDIGIIFTIMLVPFVIFPYPAGYLADKKWGEKEMLIAAIFMMAAASLAVFYVISKSIIFWGSILFITRIGASLIQTLRDSYFYKRIDGDDVDLINFYRTSVSVAYIIAPAMAFVLLGGERWFWSLDIRYVFLILAAVVFSGLYPAFRLTDNKCEAELEKCKS